MSPAGVAVKPAPDERTLPRLLGQRAERDPDGVFLTDAAGVLTTAEVWTAAGRVAAGFHALGIGPGDPVAVMMGNSREFLFVWFGLGTLGAVQVPINPQIIGNKLSYVLNHSSARAVVVDGELMQSLRAVEDDLMSLETVITTGPLPPGGRFRHARFAELWADVPRFDGARTVQPSDTTAIMYTSGSTGPPKGVVLPHGQHVENGWQTASVAAITEHDRVFVCLPLHHNMAQGYGIMPALVSGATVHLERHFDRATFWDSVRASDSTVWPFVGAMLVLLTKDIGAVEDNPLRVAYGVPIPVELHRRFEEHFALRLIPCYGSTEATIPAWGTLAGGEPLGSCGRIFEDFDVEIQDPAGWPVGPDEVGEICIRPKEPYIMFQGYHNEPERGRLALRNLWFHSGDRGRIDADGHLWFAGRSEDVMRRFGEFISASEVEEALLSCPAIDMVAAFGIPDEVAGEEVMAAVVLRPGEHLTAADVREWALRTLPQYASPRYIEIVTELPMTATGKVEKYRLRAAGAGEHTYDARQSEKGRR